MERNDIINYFKECGILTQNNKRKFCWKNKFNDNAKKIFNEFMNSGIYRSEEEAWFCLCHNCEPYKCEVCGDLAVFTGITKYGKNGYNTVCEKCSANKAKNKIDKFINTICSRNCISREEYEKQKSAQQEDLNLSAKEKRAKTNLEKFGVDCLFKLKEYRNKTKECLLEKYGAENFNNREKCKKTMFEKYGVNFIGQLPEAQEKSLAKKINRIHRIEQENDCTLLTTLVKKYGQGFKKLNIQKLKIGSNFFIKNENIPLIEKYSNEGCHTNCYVSKLEKEIVDYIKSIYNGIIIENDTATVKNLNYRTFELDILLPDLKLAFDFNGVYWHSTKYKDKFYHQRKTACARKAGIQLFHIFEDEWKNNKEKIKLKISECINKTFKNIINEKNNLIIGNNSLPIFGDIEIIEITEPKLHKIFNLEYYDAGEIVYKEL